MAIWNPSRYLRFCDERGRPFVDLVSRVGMDAAQLRRTRHRLLHEVSSVCPMP